MARYRYALDESKIQRFIKEGRGKGEGAEYLPWLTIQDVPSEGRVHRIPSLKYGRLHHLLSDLEKYAFTIYEWNDAVLDIREQFPLDREITRRIAAECGIKHPTDPETGCDIVMTTDLLLTTIINGECVLKARAVKPSEELTNRTVAKLEIERRYWQELNVDWGIVTERQLPKHFAINLYWARGVFDFEGLPQAELDFWPNACASILAGLTRSPETTLLDLSELLQIDSEIVITAIRHLAWHKQIGLNFHDEFDFAKAIPDIRLTLPEINRRSA